MPSKPPPLPPIDVEYERDQIIKRQQTWPEVQAIVGKTDLLIGYERAFLDMMPDLMADYAFYKTIEQVLRAGRAWSTLEPRPRRGNPKVIYNLYALIGAYFELGAWWKSVHPYSDQKDTWFPDHRKRNNNQWKLWELVARACDKAVTDENLRSAQSRAKKSKWATADRDDWVQFEREN